MSVSSIQIVLPFHRLQTEIRKVLPKGRLLEEEHKSGTNGTTYRIVGPGKYANRFVGIMKVPRIDEEDLDKTLDAIFGNHLELSRDPELENTGFIPKTIVNIPLSVLVDGVEQDSVSYYGTDVRPHALASEYIYGMSVAEVRECGYLNETEFDERFLALHGALYNKGWKNYDGEPSNYKISLESDDRRLVLLDTGKMAKVKPDATVQSKVSYVSGGLFGTYKALRGMTIEEEIPVDMKEKICALVGISPSDLG